MAAFVENTWNRRLGRNYRGRPLANDSFDLISAVVSAHGGWHPKSAQWWSGAVRATGERSGPTANQSAMLWRTVDFLSVILKRQIFQLLVGCALGVAELEEGFLIFPLSEDPEFRR